MQKIDGFKSLLSLKLKANNFLMENAATNCLHIPEAQNTFRCKKYWSLWKSSTPHLCWFCWFIDGHALTLFKAFIVIIRSNELLYWNCLMGLIKQCIEYYDWVIYSLVLIIYWTLLVNEVECFWTSSWK